MKNPKLYYYLFSATLVYKKSQDGETFAVDLNSVKSKEDKLINMLDIDQVQKGLINTFFNNIGEYAEGTQIVDVHIKGFSYMGFMTQEEFAPPKISEQLKPKVANPFEDGAETKVEEIDLTEPKESIQ